MKNDRYNRNYYPVRANDPLFSGLINVEETVIIEETVTASDGSTRQRRYVKTSKYTPAQLFNSEQKLLKG